MGANRWRYGWGLGSIAAGGASLLVPLYAVELGAGPAALGVLSALAAVAGAAGAFLAGRLADRTGRWRLLGTGSLVGIVVALAATPLATGVPAVVLANALLWFAFSAATPVFTMLTVEESAPGARSQALAGLNRMHGYGWAGGLALGTVWTALATDVLALSPLVSKRAFLALCGAIGVLSIVAAARWLPAGEDPTPGAGGWPTSVRRPVVASSFPFLPSKLLWRLGTLRPRRLVDRFTPTLAAYFGAVALFFAGFGLFFAPLPVFLTTSGYSDAGVFLLYVVSALGSAVFYRTAGDLTARFDSRRLQAGALSVRALALPAVALLGGAATTPDLAVMAALFAVIGLGWAVIAVAAVAFISELAPPDIRGEALGMYTALSTLAGGVGSLVGGALADTAGYPPTFVLASVLVLLSAVVILRPGLTDPTPG